MIPRSLLAFAVVPVLALAACGDDDGNDDNGTTTTAATVPADVTVAGGGTIPGAATIPDDVTIPGGSSPEVDRGAIEDALRQTFPSLRDEQVSCLADTFSGEAADLDLSQMAGAIQSCGIDPSQLGG